MKKNNLKTHINFIRYNMKVIFANIFLYFLLAAVLAFIIIGAIVIFNADSAPTSETVYNILAVHPKLIAIYKNTEIGIVSLEMMKMFLDVKNIIVGSALAKPKGGGDKAYIWGNSAALLYVPDRPRKKEPAFGYTFMWEADGAGSIQARKYFNEERETTFVEVKRYYDRIWNKREGNYTVD